MRAHPLFVTLTLLFTPRTTFPEAEQRNHTGPYSIELVDEGGSILPTFQHAGRTYVLGKLNERYLVRVQNRTGRRVEAVVSVDGRDVIDGRNATWEKRGYLIEPHGEVTILGYRLDENSVAAFRFSSVSRSYSSRMGDARDVGVVGAALFPERRPRYAPPPPILHEESGRSPPAPESLQRSAPRDWNAAPAPAEAPASGALADSRRAERRGLGTEFAEEHTSRVEQVYFERETAKPGAVVALRYDDRQGLLALGIDVDGLLSSSCSDRTLRQEANPFRRNSFAEPPPGWSTQ